MKKFNFNMYIILVIELYDILSIIRNDLNHDLYEQLFSSLTFVLKNELHQLRWGLKN